MQEIFSYLNKLKRHNNRDWFNTHKEQYTSSRVKFESTCGRLLKGIKVFDKQIDPDMQPADCIFRVYRDVRFSKDKTPYKTHFAASINPGGKKSVTAGYYVHIEPGNSFVAGGVWMPEPAMLQAIRQEIDYQPELLLKIMRSASFKKYFDGFDTEGQLKTVPKGYDKDHPQINLLKNRHFIVSHVLNDKSLLSAQPEKYILPALKAMYPLMAYLRVAQDVQD